MQFAYFFFVDNDKDLHFPPSICRGGSEGRGYPPPPSTPSILVIYPSVSCSVPVHHTSYILDTGDCGSGSISMDSGSVSDIKKPDLDPNLRKPDMDPIVKENRISN